LGGIITVIFVFFPRPLYGIFFKDEKMITLGISYLSIVGFSQLFMCAEITTSGAFNGMGKTLQPTLISIIFTSLRIPIALILIPLLGLNGIWWSISLTSIAKGILVVVLFLIVLKKIDVKETK
jgi:Na+-driven multidrug efflux pump